MKRRRAEDENHGGGRRAASKRSRHERMHNSDNRVTELLKKCLQKVCELQADLARDSDDEDDAEAAGYAACAVETIKFLAAEGLAPDHPVVTGLSQRLLKQGTER
ncbi:hypothetical protein CBL_09217 [Carabus blaptoides fortunei]